jgi:hypothetical protein
MTSKKELFTVDVRMVSTLSRQLTEIRHSLRDKLETCPAPHGDPPIHHALRGESSGAFWLFGLSSPDAESWKAELRREMKAIGQTSGGGMP